MSPLTTAGDRTSYLDVGSIAIATPASTSNGSVAKFPRIFLELPFVMANFEGSSGVSGRGSNFSTRFIFSPVLNVSNTVLS